MSYVLLDDKFWSNSKTVQAGNEAAGVYARALSYCGDHLTDGWVPLGWAQEVTKPRVRQKLVEVCFWLEVSGGEVYHFQTDEGIYTVTVPGRGYFIPDYLLYNPTRGQVERKRDEISAKRSAAGKLGAQARWHSNGDGKPDGKSNGKPMAQPMANASQTDGPPPQPPPQGSKEGAPTRDAGPLEGTLTTQMGVLRLTAAVGGGPDSQQKIERALRGYSISEFDLLETERACNGPGVEDKLAVLLSELVKRRKKSERSAA